MNANEPGGNPELNEERLPLFPVESLLLPDATVTLQIFEPRYLMMVSRCSRENLGFVMTLDTPSLVQETYGCVGKIVDFAPLSNGLLGVTVSGIRRVAISEATKDATSLWWGRAQAMPEVEVGATEAADWLSRYQPLLDALLQHPYLADQPGLNLDTPSGAVHQLMVWLPMEAALKRKLLLDDSFTERCRLLEAELSDIAGAPNKF